MRLTDLELYRWKFHHDIYIHTTTKFRPDICPMMSWQAYWREYGAFVSVLPRQSGKTQMIMTLLNSEEQDDYIVICSNSAIRRIYYNKGYKPNKILDGRAFGINANDNRLEGIKHNNINLFVDEFERIDMKNHLMYILDYPWKSVTMISSL